MPARKPDTYHRSAEKIVHYIVQFCLTNSVGLHRSASTRGFHSDFCDRDAPRPGDLVVPKSAPPSECNISWLEEVDKSAGPDGDYRYLLRSIFTNKSCWWVNIGLSFIDRDAIEPSWMWTDRQHAFNDRWLRTVSRLGDGYLYPAIFASFDGDAVTLGARVRWSGATGAAGSVSLAKWRKLKISDLAQAHAECVAQIKQSENALAGRVGEN